MSDQGAGVAGAGGKGKFRRSSSVATVGAKPNRKESRGLEEVKYLIELLANIFNPFTYRSASGKVTILHLLVELIEIIKKYLSKNIYE